MVTAHAGGTMPFVTHRFSMMEPIIGRYGITAADIVSGLRSFHYDLSSCLGHAVPDTTLTMAPPSRFVLGFDHPYLPTPVPDQELGRFFDYDALTAVERREIAFGNALKLLSRGGGRAGAAGSACRRGMRAGSASWRCCAAQQRSARPRVNPVATPNCVAARHFRDDQNMPADDPSRTWGIRGDRRQAVDRDGIPAPAALTAA